MTDIQRWEGWHIADRVQLFDEGVADSEYVTYADHLAAVQQAEQRASRNAISLIREERALLRESVDEIKRDALAGAVQRVEALRNRYAMEPGHVALCIAAIKGES